MADQRSIKSYFGAPVKQLKRKAKPTESTVVNEKKKQRDNPTARIRKFQESWKETFPWVVHDANQDVMYCSTCRRYPAFANLQSSLYIGCGSGGKYRIDSLVHHNASKEHYRCSLQFEKDSNPQYVEPIKAVVQRNVVQLSEKCRSALQCLFNTAFFVAHEELAFRKFAGLCELQKKNGVQFGEQYKNDKGCKTFISYIAQVEKGKIQSTVSDSRFMSILSDGSTDSGIVEQEAVYIRYVNKKGRSVCHFVDIVALESANADGILHAIDQSLLGIGITKTTLEQKLVGCNFDGASVMLGSKTGVATQLNERVNQNIVIMHCVAHNLELGVADAIKSVPYLQSFMNSVSQIFRFYYYSPKKRRELHGFADIFEEQAAYYSSGSQKTRWVASRHRALLALEKNFAITVKHLEHVATGTGEDAAKARGMVKAIKTEKFVTFLYFLLDVTKVLRELSLQFQSDDLFITEVSTKLETALTKLEGLKDSDPLPITATFQAKFQSNYNFESGLFKCGKDSNLDVVLNKGNAMGMQQTFSNFLTDAIAYIEKRFSSLSKPPMNYFEVFDPTKVPGERKLRASFGNDKVAALTDHFKNLLSDGEKEGAVFQWQELKIYLFNHQAMKPLDIYATLLSSRPDSLKHILVIVELMLSLSPSTAKCERCFSAMNRIKTNLKTRMEQRTLSDLLRIKGMDCEMKDFDPNPAIEAWLLGAKTKRHAMKRVHDAPVVVPTAGPSVSEPFQALPPLPELPQIDSSSDSDSE